MKNSTKIMESNQIEFDESIFWPLFITALVTTVGWFIGHYLAERRAINTERRTKQHEALLSAYNTIIDSTSASHDKVISDEQAKEVQRAFDNILLYAPLDIVQLCKEALCMLERSAHDANLSKLLSAMRNFLRSGLSIEADSEAMVSFRYDEYRRHDRYIPFHPSLGAASSFFRLARSETNKKRYSLQREQGNGSLTLYEIDDKLAKSASQAAPGLSQSP